MALRAIEAITANMPTANKSSNPIRQSNIPERISLVRALLSSRPKLNCIDSGINFLAALIT